MGSIIIRNRAKEELRKAAGVALVSSEAVAWVADRAESAVAFCAEYGRRTPGGRLMQPPAKPEEVGVAGSRALDLLKRMVARHRDSEKYSSTPDFREAVGILQMAGLE